MVWQSTRRLPGAGVLGMDGEMIDRPYLVQAKRTLQLAKPLAAF